MNATDYEDNTPLLIASMHGLCSVVELLLAADADAAAQNKGGMTALALACVKLGNMENLSEGGASPDEAPDGLAVGRCVRATVTFTTNNSKNPKEVPKGSLGKVASFDQKGNDWIIDFEGLDAKQRVLKSNFGNISVLSQEDVLKERAQREEVVEKLIAPTRDAGALNKANNEGATPLILASMRGLCGVVELLLKEGADVGKGALDHTKEIKDEEKRAAVLALMAGYSVLCAVATGKADLVAAAVAKGCEVNETDQEGNSCLHIAVANGSNEILQILLQSGADVAAKNKKGNTAVELAQNAKTIKDLKAKGATMPEIPDNDKNKRLHEYAEKGLTGGVLLVLQAGADVNHKNKAGNTAVELAQNAQTIEVLKAEGATMPEIPVKDNLHKYATKGLTGGVLLALKAGADVNHKDLANRTPLHLAAANNHHATAQLLVKHGAQVNAQDVCKQTPLYYAVLNNHHTTAQLLVEHGAQVNASFRFGGTLVAFAQEKGHRKMEALLRQHGGQ